MSSRIINKPCCTVCKTVGLSEKEYSSHYVKNREGIVICPTLLSQECRFCFKKGHTVKFCSELANKKTNDAKNDAKKQYIQHIQQQHIQQQPHFPQLKTKSKITMVFPEPKAEKATYMAMAMAMVEKKVEKTPTITVTIPVQKEDVPVRVYRKQIWMEEAEEEKTLVQLFKKSAYQRDCFRGKNGLSWADAESDEEIEYIEEEQHW